MARREGAAIRTCPTGADDQHQGPVRSCVGCRARTSASELLRVVAERGSAHSVAVPDPRRRRRGRGAWLHPDPRCLRQAERRRAFPRAFRVPGPIDLSALWEHVGHDHGHAQPVGQRDRRGKHPRQASKEAGRPVMNQP